jgi:hypothetical protein
VINAPAYVPRYNMHVNRLRQYTFKATTAAHEATTFLLLSKQTYGMTDEGDPCSAVARVQVAGEWQAPGDAATPPPATAASPNSLADIPSDTCSGSDEDDTHACLDAAANDNQQQVQEWGVSRARDQAPRCGPTAPGVPSAGAPGIQPPYKWQQHML